MSEFFVNNFATTLNGAIDNATTTVVVSSVAGAPSNGDFRVIVDNEIMLAQGDLTTTSWTVVRAQEGTSAVAHSNGAQVKHELTAGMLQLFCTLLQEAADIAALGSPLTAQSGKVAVGNASNQWAVGWPDYVPNLTERGFKAGNGLPQYTSANTAPTTALMYVMQLTIRQSTLISNLITCINSNTSVALTAPVNTATVSGAQTTPGTGNSFTLTTSSVSGYPASGWVTIGNGTNATPVATLAYSAWTGTSMTVVAGSYPISTALAAGAQIYTINNGMALYDSTGAPLQAPPDQGGGAGTGAQSGWTANGERVLPLMAARTVNANVYAGFVSTGTTLCKWTTFAGDSRQMNLGPSAVLSGAALLWSTNGTLGAPVSLPATITPSALVQTTSVSFGCWAS